MRAVPGSAGPVPHPQDDSMLVEATVGGPGAPLPSRVGFAALPEPQHRRPSPPQARTSAPVPKNCPPVQVLLSIPRLSVRYGRERRHDHSGDAPPADRQRRSPGPQSSSLGRCSEDTKLAGSRSHWLAVIGWGRRDRRRYGAPPSRPQCRPQMQLAATSRCATLGNLVRSPP